MVADIIFFFFFSSRRRHTRLQGDWSSDVCSSDLAVQVHTSDRDGDDLGAGRVDRPGHRVVVPVLPRTHHETRVERASADGERHVLHRLHGCGHAQPPPTKCTSSIASPGATVIAASRGRRTIVRLCSTTTARGSSASDSSSSSSVADRKSTRLNSSHLVISYAVFCLKKKNDVSAE